MCPPRLMPNINSVPTASAHPNSALQQLEAGYTGTDKSACRVRHKQTMNLFVRLSIFGERNVLLVQTA